MNTVASPFLSLSAVIGALRVAVASWGGRRLLDEALVHLVHRRLGEILRRMEGMVSRFQAGLLRPAGVRGAGKPGLAESPGHRRACGVRLWPCRFAWLVREVGFEAAGFGCQLRALLETPELSALLAACPQAVRVLRPLCRMLAIETQVVRPGVARVLAVRTRKRVARVTLDLGRVPIPPGAMAWVRRERPAKS